MPATSAGMTAKHELASTRDKDLRMPLRLIFMGTPEFAVPTLLELVAHGHEIAAVYTRAAKPPGRGMKLQPTPVEARSKRGSAFPVLSPATLKTQEALEQFRAHDAEWPWWSPMA
jgi:methionyl-tRNA formyltransferase